MQQVTLVSSHFHMWSSAPSFFSLASWILVPIFPESFPWSFSPLQYLKKIGFCNLSHSFTELGKLSVKGLQYSSILALRATICMFFFLILEGRYWAVALSPSSSPANVLSSVTTSALWVIIKDHLHIAFSEFLNAMIPIILEAASRFTVCSKERSLAALLMSQVEMSLSQELHTAVDQKISTLGGKMFPTWHS